MIDNSSKSYSEESSEKFENECDIEISNNNLTSDTKIIEKNNVIDNNIEVSSNQNENQNQNQINNNLDSNSTNLILNSSNSDLLIENNIKENNNQEDSNIEMENENINQQNIQNKSTSNDDISFDERVEIKTNLNSCSIPDNRIRENNKKQIFGKEVYQAINLSKCIKRKLVNNDSVNDKNDINVNNFSNKKINDYNKDLLIKDNREIQRILNDENEFINYIQKLSETIHVLKSNPNGLKQFLKSNLSLIISSKFLISFKDINDPGCIFRDRLTKLEYFKNRIKKAITDLYSKIKDIDEKEKTIANLDELVEKAEDKHLHLKQNLSYLREKLKLMNRQSVTFDNIIDNDKFK